MLRRCYQYRLYVLALKKWHLSIIDAFTYTNAREKAIDMMRQSIRYASMAIRMCSTLDETGDLRSVKTQMRDNKFHS